MANSALRLQAIQEVVAAIGVGSPWEGYRFVEREFTRLQEDSGLELRGEALRRYRYWMNWATEELSSGQTGEARTSLVDARTVQLEASHALEHTLPVVASLRPRVDNIKLIDWDGHGVLFQVTYLGSGEVLLEVARPAPCEYGTPVIASASDRNAANNTSPSRLLESGALLLADYKDNPILPTTLSHSHHQGLCYHLYTDTPGEPLTAYYSRRDAIPAAAFDTLLETLVEAVPELLAPPARLSLDPGVLVMREGKLAIKRVRGSVSSGDGRVQAVHPTYAPRWPMNPAYAILAMQRETSSGYIPIFGPFTHRQPERFTLDEQLSNEREAAPADHPIKHLTRFSLPIGEAHEDLLAALGVVHREGTLHATQPRTCARIVRGEDPPAPEGIARYMPPEDATTLGRLRYAFDSITGARVLSAGYGTEAQSATQVDRDSPHQIAMRQSAILEIGALEHCGGVPATGLLEVLAHGEDGQGRYITIFDLVPGTSLDKILQQQGSLSFETARAITVKVCAALSCLHEAGCVHMDIKPQSIFVELDQQDPIVTLSWSGIARAVDQPPDETGIIYGSLGYMSPEQLMGNRATTPAVDIWGLACTVIEMVLGEAAFPLDLGGFMSAIQRSPESIDALERIGAQHPSLRILLERCLARAPEDRPSTCAAFAQALQSIDSSPIETFTAQPPVPSPEDTRQPHRVRTTPLPRHSPTPPIADGQLIANRYRLLSLIRDNIAYSAHKGMDTTTRESVEVRVYRRETLSTYPNLAERMRASWRTYLSRPRLHSQRLRDFGQTADGGLFAVFDRLSDAPTLQELSARQPMTVKQREAILMGVILALAELEDLDHEIVHPNNIHVIEHPFGPPQVILTEMEQSPSLLQTEPGQRQLYPAGLMHYVAPEMLSEGSARTSQTDVWNVGALAYWLETGRPAFAGEGAVQIVAQILTKAPESFGRWIVGGHDANLERVVMRCLSRSLDERYKTLAEAHHAFAATHVSGP